MPAHPPILAVSTWSLHRAMGVTFPNTPAQDSAGAAVERYGPKGIDLLDLPARLRSEGYDRIEICHFHVARRDPAYLAALRAALAEAGVVPQMLLIDDGDISCPVHGARDAAWVGAWIDAAAALGAERARVIAGKQKPGPEALERSVGHLRALARRGREQGVRVVTENWFDLLGGPREVLAVLDALEGEVGLIADFHNWRGPDKYDGLAAIMPRAETTHAKAHFPASGMMDSEDFGRCLDIARAAGFAGPHSLIYDGPDGDEWDGLRCEREFLMARYAAE